MATLRDKLWLFGFPVDSHRGKTWLPEGRMMSTLEGACYLGIPNALVVVQADVPVAPFDRHVLPLTPLKRVVWSVLGDSKSYRNDVDEVLRLAEKFPNITGGILDDFFRKPDDAQGPLGRFNLEELAGLRDRLHGAPRPLELWLVLYAHQLGLPVEEYLDLSDVITFWTWRSKDLTQLEDQFDRLEAMAPHKPKMLGCYFRDLDDGREIPVDRMKYQCELGLRWLHAGRIAGIILLGSSLCGLGLDAVEWARDWIAEIGDEAV